jgi:hypothetical protein
MALQHLRSATANKRPSPSSMSDGQLAVNTNSSSPGLFAKDSGNALLKIGPVHIGATAPNASPASGGHTGNSIGEQWLDTSSARAVLKAWNGSAWVEAAANALVTARQINGTNFDGTTGITTASWGTGRTITVGNTGKTVDGSGNVSWSLTEIGVGDPSRFVTTENIAQSIAGVKTFTSTITGSISGNAGTATTLQTARNINGTSFNGSGNITTASWGTSRSISIGGTTKSVDGSTNVTWATSEITANTVTTNANLTGDVTSVGNATSIAAGVIVNADISASAAIAYSKLAALNSANILVGSSTNVPTARAVTGDVTIGNTGVTAIASGVIVNADVNASAAISGTKISPDFGGQTITTTGVISPALGTAAAPSIAFTGDLDTGVFSPGADQVAVATNGAGRLFINGTGQVGINTDSDGIGFAQIRVGTFAASLTPNGYFLTASNGALASNPGWISGLTLESDAGGTPSVSLVSPNSTTAGAQTYQKAFEAAGSGAGSRSVIYAGGSERLRITPAGLVGIGTTAPATVLSNNSALASDGTQFAGSNSLNWRASNTNAYIAAIENLTTGNGLLVKVGDSNPARKVIHALDASNNSLFLVQGDGRVGIGTTSPATTLDVNGGVTITDKIIHGGDTDTAIRFPANDTVSAETNGSERARIDSSGRLLVGTSTARTNFNNTADATALQVEATSFVGASLSLVRNVANASSGGIIIGKTRGASVGSNTLVANGDGLGGITWQGADGTSMVIAASIAVNIDAAPGTNNMPGRLVFSTTADGESSPTERMRITNNGGFMVGQTVAVSPGFGSTTTGAGFANTDKVLYLSSASSPPLRLNRNSDGSIVDFRRSGSAGTVGSISITTTNTAYNTSSDYRLKENVVDLDGAIDRLKLLPVHRFNFIADPDTVVDGFIAHEAAEVVPECVTGTKDEVDEDGNPQYQGIDQSKIVPLLTAALQEAIAKIETLEQRLAAAGID